MSKKRKKGKRKSRKNDLKPIETIVFATAILNLINAVIEFIKKLTG